MIFSLVWCTSVCLECCAEIIQPDSTMLALFRKKEIMAAHLYWRSLASKDRDDPDMTGRPALEHALRKARQGQVGVGEVERGFGYIDGFLVDRESVPA